MNWKRTSLGLALFGAWFGLGAGGVAGAEFGPVAPTVFLTEQEGQLRQLVMLTLPRKAKGELTVRAEQEGAAPVQSRLSLVRPETAVPIFVPACPAASCATRLTLTDGSGQELGRVEFALSYQRRWKIYLSPFSHLDVGFTNSQRKILAQNLDNLRAALRLIEQTRDYPEGARFKFFTEVSWPASEFLYSDATTASEKEQLLAELKAGTMELGGFLLSHQNKFLAGEALFRSPEWALRISREFGVPLRTACLNDVMDFSGIVKPLHAAGIPYFIGGPNTSRYAAPPLFYLLPVGGEEKILVWLTPHLNGYGENFDLEMRPDLPISESALARIESRLGPYLKSLETEGTPPRIVQEHFDFFGAHWEYPFDLYFLPFYPAHAVDNGPQDLTAAELARAWNARWAYPRMIIATPAEFFAEAQSRFSPEIPVLRGDLPGFWGEQIFFSLAQTDPERTQVEREFVRQAVAAEMRAVERILAGEPAPAMEARIAEGFKLLLLNNDHNPGPVPFGHTAYTKQDVAEWKETRRQWIQTLARISADLSAGTVVSLDYSPGSAHAWSADEQVVLENDYYRVEIDPRTGGISRLYDKELNRELSAEGPYQLNQYVVVARGENAGTRGNLFTRPGFKRVTVRIEDGAEVTGAVKAVITGEPAAHPDAVNALTRFLREALGLRMPGWALKALLRGFGVKLGPLDELTQEVILPAKAKRIDLVQRIKFSREQIVDHAFAYPLRVPAERSLIVEGPYHPYSFSLGPPLGDGDLIPGAKMRDPRFPSINALTQVFGWMHGRPADAVFEHYVVARGDGFAVAFSSLDSGVILPGPPGAEPAEIPGAGGFSHLVLGWTAYGRAFLGAPAKGELVFRSALTSFPAADAAEANARAAEFSQKYFTGSLAENNHRRKFRASPPAVMITAARPLSPRSILFRLYESSGNATEAALELWSGRPLMAAGRARSDGAWLSGRELRAQLVSSEGEYHFRIPLRLSAGEVATVRVDWP